MVCGLAWPAGGNPEKRENEREERKRERKKERKRNCKRGEGVAITSNAASKESTTGEIVREVSEGEGEKKREIESERGE